MEGATIIKVEGDYFEEYKYNCHDDAASLSSSHSSALESAQNSMPQVEWFPVKVETTLANAIDDKGSVNHDSKSLVSCIGDLNDAALAPTLTSHIGDEAPALGSSIGLSTPEKIQNINITSSITISNKSEPSLTPCVARLNKLTSKEELAGTAATATSKSSTLGAKIPKKSSKSRIARDHDNHEVSADLIKANEKKEKAKKLKQLQECFKRRSKNIIKNIAQIEVETGCNSYFVTKRKSPLSGKMYSFEHGKFFEVNETNSASNSDIEDQQVSTSVSKFQGSQGKVCCTVCKSSNKFVSGPKGQNTRLIESKWILCVVEHCQNRIHAHCLGFPYANKLPDGYHCRQCVSALFS